MKKYLVLLASAFVILLAGGLWLHTMQNPTVDYTYKVVNSFEHDPNAFTQGLVFENGLLYEGTGLYGCSSLRKVKLETGEVLQSSGLAPELFGEGITIFQDRIIQLTYTSGTAFVYDKNNFNLIKSLKYLYEGWGITHDGKCLISSDGTENLYFLNPETLKEIRRVSVKDGNMPVKGLNELEYIDGVIFANVWLTDWIVKIEPGTGKVVGRIDLAGLCPAQTVHDQDAVLNGIAYDHENKRLFVTGKFWPKLYEIALVPVR